MLTSNHDDNQDRQNSDTNFFRFQNQEVRVILLNNEPAFCLSDSLKAIKSNTTVTAARDQIEEGLDEGFVINQPLKTSGGMQNVYFVFEAGLTYLLSRSRTEEGKKLNQLIHTEILPSIRKTGSYSMTQKNLSNRFAEDLMLAEFAANAAKNAGVDPEIAEQIKLESLMNVYPDSQPLLMPQQNAIAASRPLPEIPMTPTEVGEKLAIALRDSTFSERRIAEGNRLGYAKVSAKRVNSKLLELGYQISVTRIKKSNGKEVHDYYQPTEKGKPYSQLQMTAYVEGEGKSTKAQLRWFSSIVTVLQNNWEEN